MQVIVAMVVAMTSIVIGDAAGKVLGQAGTDPFTIAWARFALAAVVLAPLVGFKRSEARAFTDWRLVVRAALIAAGIACILTALKTVPLADTFAVFFIGPVVAYGLSVVVLKERVSYARTGLLALSFVGVLVIVRPTGDMQPGILWALAAGCFHGCYLVATRWLAQEYRPRLLLWSQLVIGTVILTPLALAPLPALDPWIITLFGISALGSATGNFILVQVNRSTPASVVAPLVYTQLVAAAGVGWLWFGDLPDAVTWVGLVVIIGAGVAAVRVAARGG